MLGTTLSPRAFLERMAQELLRLDPREVEQLSDSIYDCYKRDRFVFVIGNGGSGSNAFPFSQDRAKQVVTRATGKSPTAARAVGRPTPPGVPPMRAPGFGRGKPRREAEPPPARPVEQRGLGRDAPLGGFPRGRRDPTPPHRAERPAAAGV